MLIRRWLGRARRFCEESFQVELEVADRRDRLPCRWSAYAADPFLLEDQGRVWIFFEEFEYWKGKGRICCRELLNPGRWGPLEVVMDEPFHLSFPFVFSYAGDWWMIPECSQQRSVDLYRAISLPRRWEKAVRLLDDIDAVDSILWQEGQRWWLFTFASHRPRQARHLQVYSAPNLTSPWQPHPVNQKRLYAGQPFQTGRNAGPIFEVSGKLYRPVQYSQRFYGEALRLAEVSRLTEQEYVEEPTLQILRGHHLHRAGAGVCHDHRTRFPWSRRSIYLPGGS